MTPALSTRHHVTIFVPPDIARPIDAIRRTWDPVMAAQIAAHVTLVYPEEAPDLDVLVARLRAAGSSASSFRLRLGGLACFGHPEAGVYVVVDDLDGGYRRLRDDILGPPFHALDVPPHVTLVHPRTSARGPQLWAQERERRLHETFEVSELALTGFDGARWQVMTTFALAIGE